MNKQEKLIENIEFISQELEQLEQDLVQAKEDLTEEPFDNEAEIQALFKEVQTYNVGILAKRLANELHIATRRLISKKIRLSIDGEHIFISNIGIAIPNYYNCNYLKNLRTNTALKYYGEIALSHGLKIIDTIHKQDKKEIIQLIINNASALQNMKLGVEPIEYRFTENDQTIDTVVLNYSTIKYRKIILSSLTIESTDDGNIFMRIMNDQHWTLERIYLHEKIGWNEKQVLSKLLKNTNTKKAIQKLIKQYKEKNETIIKQAQELIGKLGVYTLIEAL
jgi:hypothetical protein